MGRRFTLEQKAEMIGRYLVQKEGDPKLREVDYCTKEGLCRSVFQRWKRDTEVLSAVNGGNAFVKVADRPKSVSGKARMSTGFRLVRRDITVEFDAGADTNDVRTMIGLLEG